MKKVVFITGASRGIGAATVKKFVSQDWLVAGFYNENRIQNTEYSKYYQMDISNWESVKGAFDKAFSDFGRVDCLVNNAGMFGFRGLGEYDEELMNNVIGVNEKGTYWGTKAILDKMTEGSIVNISSTAAQVGSSDPVYAGTKAAILGFTKSMAKALAPKIRVNCVAPSATNTDMFKTDPGRVKKHEGLSLLGRIAEPEDIANGIYFLASDEARHVTGACLDINGGYVLR